MTRADIVLGIATGLLGGVLMAAAQQQPDPAKMLPFLKQQREAAFDNIAACSVLVTDQQARIAELEKQLVEAKAAPK